MKNIWMLSFESFLVRKVGGLAEVPPRLAEAITRKGYSAVVVTPGHGITAPASSKELFSAKIDGETYKIVRLDVKPEHLIALGGVLNDPNVYSGSNLLKKSVVFGILVASYIKYLVEQDYESIPIVVHGNDWHSFPALLLVNSFRTERNLNIKLVYQLHLFSKLKIGLDFLQHNLGLSPETLVTGVDGVQAVKHYYDRSKGWIEKFVFLTVDKYVTVSKGYVKDVERNLGLDVAGKIDFIPNALVWTTKEVFETVKRQYDIENPLDPKNRKKVRRRILTEELKNVEGIITEPNVESYVRNIVDKYELSTPKPFKSDGELLFLSGRLAGQKGLEDFLDVLEEVVIAEPNVRILMAYIPIEGSASLLEKLGEYSLLFDDHLRVIIGKIPIEKYLSIYFAADAYIAPSRYEPFGLVAVEALAAGTPVVASRTGGLKDIVIDIRKDFFNGVGILFNPRDKHALLNAVLELLERMRDPTFEKQIRSNCVKRAEEFSWDKSAEKALNTYFS
ncbi:MAG: glycosyltransferase [Thermosphaera sp.]